jgi:endoglucanase
MDAHEASRRLGRGINFSGVLDVVGTASPWCLDERHLDVAAEAGFSTVRLPTMWSAHADTAPAYTIDPGFCERVDRAVDSALGRGSNVVLNVHHYNELSAAPERHAERFLALWRQIAPRYADRSPRLYLELLNEPHGGLTAPGWNALLADALTVVRESDPQRIVVVGPARRNVVAGLAGLELPDDDRLIATLHFYLPFEFTHQGAEWLPGADAWIGTTWGEQAGVVHELARAGAWARANDRPIFLGEFGVLSTVPMAARAAWTALVRAEAERLGFSWAYWDFATDFGAFDTTRHTWRAPLRDALMSSAGRVGSGER